MEANTTYMTALLECSPYPLCFFTFDGHLITCNPAARQVCVCGCVVEWLSGGVVVWWCGGVVVWWCVCAWLAVLWMTLGMAREGREAERGGRSLRGSEEGEEGWRVGEK
eukprot:2785158-Rhodomonas_salina.1